jgi:large subunit ribosomal protein L2
MGKRIIQRARGKGSMTYRSPGHRFEGKIKYPRGNVTVIDIIHDAARNAPLARVVDSEKRETLIIATEGMKVGQKIVLGAPRPVIGNIMKLSDVPKGASVFAIENIPGSGPQLCCSPGSRAIVVGSDKNEVIIKMPSKTSKRLKGTCLVTLGIPAGAGARDKPFYKAGQKMHTMRARNKLYPRTSATAMNAVDHPFGGQTKPGQSKTISRWAPPGAKVGSVAARSSGKKKR